jgi:uncharacterized protein with PQ loop repeat
MIGFHHLRERARISQGLEPFPSRDVWKRLLDYLMYGVGIIAPLALVPQIIEIYTTRSSVGVSLYTWLLVALFNALWALYGIVHKDRQLFLANVFMVLFDLVIVVGILMY